MNRLLEPRWSDLGLGLAALVLVLACPPAYEGHGLEASFWDDSIHHQGEPQLRKVVRQWDVSMDGNQASTNHTIYSVRWTGFVEPPVAGEYAFALDSDDGSKLWLDNSLLVDNGGRHPRRRKEGARRLEAGEHALKLEYIQTIGESFLELRVRPPDGDWQPVPLAWMRPVRRAEFDQAAADTASLIRWILLTLAGLCLVVALGLRIRVARSSLARLLENRDERRAALGSLLKRPVVQDLMVVAICLPFYIQAIGVRLPHEPYMKGDSIYYANTAISILHDQDLDQKNQTDRRIFENPRPHTTINLANSNISRGSRGEWYPKHPILMPLLSAPFYAVWGGFGFVIYNLVVLLLVAVAIRRFAVLVVSPPAAGIAAVLIGLTPLMHNFAYSYCPDLLSALLVVAGLGAATGKRPLMAGVLLGLSVWAKLPNGLVLALVGGWMLIARDWKNMARFMVGSGVALGLFAGLNWYQFGAPWLTGYQRVWVIERGVSGIGDHVNSFSRPFWDGVHLQLFNPVNGLMHTAAMALVALLGSFSLWARSRAALTWIAVFSVAMFLFYSVYDFTHASHFSNRFLMPVVALAGIPLACLIEALFARTNGLSKILFDPGKKGRTPGDD